MTTMTQSPVATASRAHAMNRVLAVTRLHFVNRWSMFALPSMILGVILLLNAAIWYIVLASSPAGEHAHVEKGFTYTGSVFYIFVYMLVVAVQAISRTFPFALGYGVTRRNFYLGSALAFVIMSVLYSVGLTVLSLIEVATHGWGAGGHMFTPTYFTNADWGIRLVMYFFAFLFFFFLGSAIASVYVRWKTTGIVVFFAIVAVVLVGIVALITLGNHWPAVVTWFANTGTFGVSAWSLVVTAIAAIAGYFVLQRATPKN
jgi:hypothetical protein